MSELINIAHRGASGDYPENSLLAFEKAVEMGCDVIELDLQLTKDGVVVVFHDEKLDRITDGSGLLVDYNYSQLSKLEILDNNENRKYAKQRIITLEELLERFKNQDIVLNLELKNNIVHYPGLEKKVCDLLKKYDFVDKSLISSFNHYSLIKVNQICPELDLGIIYLAALYKAEKYADSLPCKIKSLHPLFTTLDQDVVANIKNAGYKIYAYTINEEKHIKYMFDLEIDGIITDYPDKLKNISTRYE